MLFSFSSSFSLTSNPFRHFDSPNNENDDFDDLGLSLSLSLSFVSPLLLLIVVVLLLLLFSSISLGSVKLSRELVEERGETGRWERRWRGRRWPWKNISSAGDKSTAAIEGRDLAFSGFVEDCGGWWREIVKENSCAGEEEAEGGEAVDGGGGGG